MRKLTTQRERSSTTMGGLSHGERVPNCMGVGHASGCLNEMTGTLFAHSEYL